MKRIFPLALICAAAALCLFSTWAADRQGRPLPAWAARLIAKEFPETETLRFEREGDQDENRFEVRLKRNGDGGWINVDLTEDSGIVDIDEEVKNDQLPERVSKALLRAFPRSDIKAAEKNTDIRVSYSIDIVADGKKREVRISPRGRILEIEKRD